MKKILFLHGGSGNHGCEAIIRTTTNLLKGPKGIVLWTSGKAEDIQYGTDKCVEKIVATDELKRGSLAYCIAQVKLRLFGKKNAIHDVFIKKLFKGNVAISVGGDNYCYGNAEKDIVPLDKEIRKYCKKTVLWGCSVGEEDLTEKLIEDLSQFDLITARESISYETLKKINPNTYLVADPAFLLRKEELPLPKQFLLGNTVGINVSPLIMQYTDDKNVILDNYRHLIEYILKETGMNICLIPHVVWEYNNDREPINYLYEQYKGSGRVCKIEDGTAPQIKGYIARCRFFVGARTHATIAAYSTCVPTLVVGYSVKSRGIAKDLFGDHENYVVSVQNLQTEDTLTKHFVEIQKNEDSIRQHLTEIMPEYKGKAKLATEFFDKIIREK